MISLSSNLLAAEDSQTNKAATPASPQKGAPPTQNSTNNTTTDTKRVIPTPQVNRIKALENRLKQNQQSHQINILNADNTPFLTLYRESQTRDTEGCVILLPSDNEHPDWPTVIAPLRNALPQYSWCTISMEIPDITPRANAITTFPEPSFPTTSSSTSNTATDNNSSENTKNSTELPNQKVVFDRLQAVITEAKQKGAKQIVLVGYGTGAAYAMTYLATNPQAANALAIINVDTAKPITDYQLAQQIRQINVPILDYYYGQSMALKRFALWRKQSANKRSDNSLNYVQMDAFAETQRSMDGRLILIQYVRGFLKQNTQQKEQLKPLPDYDKGLFYKDPSDDETE
ncbi:hypothetical protein MSP8887_00939 [Marinomonas spartinae]|uniref:Alpha/beta hydrolase family protein n=2 Tax=Marinomonas spartinae TaxID=1792290 RepID=A0A1A8T6Z9_9GAMM|nr:hypothetical protein MSP8886_01024 [Marinomonas spartinae]SBS28679.1 hypothetical protein MSP8887_00939 [Marinomonas spartinae]